MNTETSPTATAVAEQGATVAPRKATSNKGASPKKAGPKPKRSAKVAPSAKGHASKKAAQRERKSSIPHAQSKGAMILALIGRAKGATLAEIMQVTQWQAHSVRGFISTAAKQHKVHIESFKNDAGDRVYKTVR